jgi:hypothetical protein
MRDMGDLHKYLDFLQQTIARMATMSLQVKTWSIGLVSGILALAAAKDGEPRLIAVAFLPAVMLWVLDAFYLEQERRFRGLYDRARVDPGAVTFSMDTRDLSPTPGLRPLRILFSWTLALFHGAVAATVLTFLLVRP